jgi:hypothetical protein
LNILKEGEMALDIWFADDVTNALKAAEQASATTAAAMESVVGDPRYLRAYREGYRAALITVATAFGITPPDRTSSAEFTVSEAELLRASSVGALEKCLSV